MIHMLSRFDLKPDCALHSFATAYHGFVSHMQSAGLVEATGRIGKRLSDTPMDTDDADKSTYYALMTFRDREQLDAAYAYMTGDVVDPRHRSAHDFIKLAVVRPVFTCWQE